MIDNSRIDLVAIFTVRLRWRTDLVFRAVEDHSRWGYDTAAGARRQNVGIR
jgi:hypothetical protein